jgi:gamma-glutamyl-gamma-aminobutyrate hydrolase PuuD
VNAERPVVGVTTYLEPATWMMWERPAAVLPRSYVDCIAAAGGVPVLLPPVPAGAAEAVAAVGALVLSGGADVDPERYGEALHPATVLRPDRDDWELALLQAALDRDIPVLAICRGAQVLNVACGGTLHQHLPEVTDHPGHLPGHGVYGASLVRVLPGSRLAGIVGTALEVPCYHHQAVDRVGAGLVATAWAEDGTVEAVEHTGHRLVLGVQWHPEQPVPPDGGIDGRLFTALVGAAAAATAGRGAR